MKRLLIMVIVLVAAALVATGCANNVNPGGSQVLLVVGDDVKDRSIQETLCPGGGAKDIGIDNVARRYHHSSSPRYYEVTTADNQGDRPGPDQVRVETSEGITVGIEFIGSFHTNFDCKGEGKKLVEKFHTGFGNRNYPVPGAGDGTDGDVSAKVYQGDRGWGAFLDKEVRVKGIDPVVKDLFKPMACREISTTCAAMQNARAGGDGAQALATPEDGKKVATNLDALEKQLVEALNAELKQEMGEQYLEFTEIDITAVNLPKEMAESVRRAQTANATLAETQAETERLRINANADLERARIEAATKKLESQQFSSAQRLELLIAQARGCGNARNCTVIVGDVPSGVRVEG